MAEEEKAHTVNCPECGPVHPDTVRCPSIVAGSVTTLQRCPYCGEVLQSRVKAIA
jgi:uncharacterized Zn finger protein